MQGPARAVHLPTRLLLASALALALGACSSDHDDDEAAPPPQTASRIQVEVSRTAHGVPHVRAENFRSLAYGLAHAYAQDNLCMFADSVVTVRGERALFFGGQARPRQRAGDEYGGGSNFMDLNNEESDFFFKGYLDIEQLRANYAAGPAEPRELLEGFVEGYNRYIKDNAGKLPAACATPSGCVRSRSTICTWWWRKRRCTPRARPSPRISSAQAGFPAPR